MTIRIFTAVLLVLLAPPLVAQDEPPLAQDEPRLFDVELIIFRHLTPDDSELQVEREKIEDETPVQRRRFTPLTPDELRLAGISQKLLRSKDWSPVLHYGWRQPAVGHEDSPVVSVAGNRRGAYAAGGVRLSLERFLRLELDLQMDPGTGISYTLEQARRMRSGQVHYFDHPQFGVIALVSRAELPKP